ncbi:MAG TPA: cobyric acid synthase [Armatimonadota bacterium]|nr:cobyric acid synthase [Armatimonadota bacterium]
MSARTLMIQGTASHVGKSVVVAGFCRLFARRGYRTSPFKSQNMALNSYVTADGREIGRSQAFQARAAGVEPMAEMNPVLLKPRSENGSQVIVLGKPVRQMEVREYHAYQSIALDAASESLRRLRETFDVIVMEGAGSPAEVNLRDRDIANMKTARMGEAPVILVGDIERGGVFASLYGTLALLLPEDRERVAGLIINKFRGDVSLLNSGLEFLERECGVPVLGVLPYLRDLRVEEEDSLSLPDRSTSPDRPVDATSTGNPKALIAVIRLPHLSNFTDFDALAAEEEFDLRYAERLADSGRPDLVILPGTKNTAYDLRWLREQGFAEALCRYAASGGRIMGICGGYQMLGRRILDPEHVESACSLTEGLGLLDVETTFRAEKTLERVEATGCAGWMDGVPTAGYEIHQGSTERGPSARPLLGLSSLDGSEENRLDGAIDPAGMIAGTYLHGFFDRPEVRSALRGFLGLPPSSGANVSGPASLEVFDRLADWLEQNLDMERIFGIMGVDGLGG